MERKRQPWGHPLGGLGKAQETKTQWRLGFKDIQCFNLALLAKIGWRIIKDPSSLLATILKDKYFPDKTFRDASRGNGTSWGWKGIYEARKVIENGCRWRVGDGTSINIREDPWFPKPSTFKVQSRDNLQATRVCDLIDPLLGGAGKMTLSPMGSLRRTLISSLASR